MALACEAEAPWGGPAPRLRKDKGAVEGEPMRTQNVRQSPRAFLGPVDLLFAPGLPICCPLVLSCAGRRRLHEASPGCLAPCPLLSVLSRPLAQLLAENALSHALPRAVRATLT